VRFGTVVPLVSARALGSREFTYELPEGVAKGAVVSVPFGRGRQRGVVVGGELEAPARAWRESEAGEVPAEPALVVGQHTLADPSRAPAGRHTLYAYTHLPQRPRLDDDAIVDRVERQIERFAPGFRDTILARSVRGPAAIERENPSMVGGDLGGGAYGLDQQGPLRPAPRLVRGRTPVRGLYVAGASVHPGGGVHGVSGDGAARALLEDASPSRLRR
jgi:phytoene dehydrogenase-like protein